MNTSTVQTKTIKLPNALTIAIGQYFLSWAVANPHMIGSTYKGGLTEITYSVQRPWNKEECFKRIDAILPEGWGYQACAGSFWIFKKGNKKTHYYIDNETWPLAEIRLNKAR